MDALVLPPKVVDARLLLEVWFTQQNQLLLTAEFTNKVYVSALVIYQGVALVLATTTKISVEFEPNCSWYLCLFNISRAVSHDKSAKVLGIYYPH